ncbi:SRPBCC domain-containing protein [Massilia antarctica]|uniref:SRPBCC domain-containing protein n=1 Tax=Massilia antarctica TaxID=2765360 RepID=A0AA48WAX8_9BURK|nr:SRPBCC domain-containing protein [Massilia antarctica]QPI48097.1 SRPBCC domain-containing protein [Massilia antarctica]
MTSPDPSIDFVLTRVFDAPRDLVFKTMIETAHLQKWWGPQGCTIEVIRHEPLAGGVFHYCMRFGPGVEMYGKFEYREIAPPGRLVFINGFADAEGKRIHYELSPTWPLEVLNTVVLSEAGGKTSLHLHSTPLDASAVEIETFKAGHGSMQQGFGGMYDEYEKYLATVKNAQA